MQKKFIVITTQSANNLQQNKLYVMAKRMKKNVDDIILITITGIYSKVRNVVNSKALYNNFKRL